MKLLASGNPEEDDKIQPQQNSGGLKLGIVRLGRAGGKVRKIVVMRLRKRAATEIRKRGNNNLEQLRGENLAERGS